MAITSTTVLSDLVKASYERAILLAFAEVIRWRPFALTPLDPTPEQGNPLNWTIINQLALVSSALSETTEPTPVSMSDSQVAATLAEYGAVVTLTEKLRKTSFVGGDLNALKAIQIVAANMHSSLDALLATAALAGTNVVYSGGVAGRTSIGTTNKLSAADIRKAVTTLATNKVPRFGDAIDEEGRKVASPGSSYICIAHPHALHDLKSETGAGSWRAPKEYADPAGIYEGEIGMFEGARFIEDASGAALVADASNGAGAAGTIDVYRTQLLGQQYLGEAGVTEELRVTGPFDNLGRFLNAGWYALKGFARVQEAAGVRIESASSLGANT